MNPANNSASDPTTIVPGPILTITKSHTGNFTQGRSGATCTVPARFGDGEHPNRFIVDARIGSIVNGA